MVQLASEKPTLSRGGPQVFFRGRYAFRSQNGMMAVIVTLLTTGVFSAIAVFGGEADEALLGNLVRAGFALMGLISGVLSLWTFGSWIGNRRVGVEINGDGIVAGNRYWAWDNVRRFYGKRHDNGVCLEFTPRERLVWGGGVLPTTPLLTNEEYIDLAGRISRELSIRFPHVDVAARPEVAAADM